VCVAAAAGAYVVYDRAHTPFRGYEGSERLIEIPSGLGTNAIGGRLIEAGVVRDRLTFRTALWLSGDARRLQAGEYRFDRPMTPLEVLDRIARGDVDRVKITFPEGLTIAEMAAIFESGGFGTAASFVAAANDASPIASVDGTAKNLEGYLFPDTYSVPRHIKASDMVRAMVDQFRAIAPKDVQGAARDAGWTLREMVTVASLVEKETAKAEERPLVAAVYANRLRIGMPLQCDPTVIYALQLAGKYDGNIRKTDLSIDSPYNTYRVAGLPPGPIAAPGKGALEAAAHPADVNYLYFVSRNDGSHEFAATLAEHNRNVQKYQVQYFRDLRANRAGGAGRAGGSGRPGTR
jgi:UPF0755 protein